jgi:lipopolysaccharide/colanic/teichoic acid biosynthesis glycosyltransferase
MERFFDILFSGLALLVFLPLLVPIAIVLKCSEEEVFFSQERIGKDGKVFKLFEFATMLKDSPNLDIGSVIIKDDSRVLSVSKFLRKSKINELPQLPNIVFGNISVIGPRPLRAKAFSSYLNKIQDFIVLVRPGLSGVGSIVFRGEEDIMHGAKASIDYY